MKTYILKNMNVEKHVTEESERDELLQLGYTEYDSNGKPVNTKKIDEKPE